MTTNRQRSLTSDLYKSNCTLSELKTSILWERPIKNEKTEKKKKTVCSAIWKGLVSRIHFEKIKLLQLTTKKNNSIKKNGQNKEIWIGIL